MSGIDDIKKLVGSKKLVIGTNNVMKNLKKGLLAKVFVSSNAPENIKNDLRHYTTISKIELVELEVPNDELGTICKKPFSVGVLGVQK